MNERKIDLHTWEDFLPRLVFALIIQRILGKESGSLDFTHSLLELKLLDGNFVRISFAYFLRYFRTIFFAFVQAVITFYIFSSDKENSETKLDLVINFTALFILCEIDQMFCLDGMEDYIEDIRSLDCERFLFYRFREK